MTYMGNLEIIKQRIKKVVDNNLLYLDLSCLNITEIPKELFNLNDIYEIDLSYNKISKIPDELLELKKLQNLNLSFNSIFELNFKFAQSYSLKEIDITYNNFYSPPNLEFLETEIKIIYFNNPFIRSLPEEVADMGLDSISYYYHSMRKHKSFNRLFELKLLLVGAGDVGKTSIINHLKDRNFKLEIGTEKPTIGIETHNIEKWLYFPATEKYYNYKNDFENLYMFNEDVYIDEETEESYPNYDIYHENVANNWQELDSNTKLNLRIGILPYDDPYFYSVHKQIFINTWDFGGQEINFNTHQFFLTKRSIYLLVWEPRKDNENDYLEYWLTFIKLLADNSPVIIIMNKSDIRIKEIDEIYYKKKYKNIVDFIKVSSYTKDGLPTLEKLINETIIRLPHLGEKLPSNWHNIKKTLKQLNKDYISFAEFKLICNEGSIVEDDNGVKIISQYLNDTGDIIYFSDEMPLKDLVILNSEWATKSVYTLINNVDIQKNSGKFSINELNDKFDTKKYPPEKHFELIKLMEKFEICFNMIGTNDYIIPELLSFTLPKYDLKVFKESALRIEYEYNYLSNGIINRLMCRFGNEIGKNLFWKNGFIIKNETTEALIINNHQKKTIEIKIIGEESILILAKIKFEIEQINKQLKISSENDYKLKYACNCTECQNNENPYFFENEKILNFLRKKKEITTCINSAEDINLRELYNGYKTKNPQYELIYPIVTAIHNFLGASNTLSKDENSRNTYITSVLSMSGIIAKDQSLYGKSSTGKKPGELDVKITDEKQVVMSLYEGINLNGLDKSLINTHIKKTIQNYNPTGLNIVYLGIYYDGENFVEFKNRYIGYLNSNEIKEIFVFNETIDVTNIYYKYGTEIFIFKTKYKKKIGNESELVLFSILINTNH